MQKLCMAKRRNPFVLSVAAEWRSRRIVLSRTVLRWTRYWIQTRLNKCPNCLWSDLRMLIQSAAAAHHLVGDEARLVAYQEQRQVGDVLRLADAAERGTPLRRAKHLVRIDAAQELVVDQSRCDSVDADAMFPYLGGHRSGVAHYCRFSGAVVCLAIAGTDPTGYRRQAHNLTRLLCDHVR